MQKNTKIDFTGQAFYLLRFHVQPLPFHYGSAFYLLTFYNRRGIIAVGLGAFCCITHISYGGEINRS
jgi:hypothetical protein